MPHTRSAAVLAIPMMILLLVSRSVAQEKPGPAQEVQKRLTAAQKPHGATILDNVIATLFATHNFQQAAISPDGNAIAWVEEVHSKNGVVSGSTVIYVKNLKAGPPPKLIGARTADSLHAETDL